METHFKFGFGHNLIRACHRWPLRRFLGAAVVMAVLVSLGAATKALVDGQDKSGAAAAQASGGIDFVSAQLTVPLAPSPAHGDNDDQPDRAADFVGGVAARVRADDGQPIPGDLFLLMATEGSAAHAQLFDDTPYGLAAAVFTANGRRGIRAARDIKAGTVTINCYGEGDVSTPFGGYKQSGFGGRDNGVHAHDQYTELKTIWIDLTDPADGDNVA